MTTRLLVVEDSPTQVEQLRYDLETAGYEVTVATDGVEGYASFVADPPDAVLTDIVMPRMDGYALCQAVKQHPTLGHTPVVLLTSLTDPAEILRALEAGADNFLHKPCESEYLRARLGDVLAARTAPRPGDERIRAEVGPAGQRISISFAKHQLLDLMYSSFEELTAANAALRAREENLRTAQADLRSLLTQTESERRRLAAVLDSIPEAMLIVEADGTVAHATDEMARLLGRDLASISGSSVTDTLPLYETRGTEPELLPPERHLVTEVLAGRPAADSGRTYGTWLAGAEGLRPVAVLAAQVPAPDGSPAGAVVVISDLGGQALRDRVTGMAGPDLFVEHVGAALAAARPGQRAGVLLVRLDRFDALSESLGDDVATFLAAAARRLGDTLDAAGDGLIGYLGRGEFGVLLAPPAMPRAAALGARLLEELRRPLSVGTAVVASTASIGVALAPEHRLPASRSGSAGPSTDRPQFAQAVRLLRAAGTALRRAGSHGGNRVELSDEHLRDVAAARLRLESALRTAVAGGQLAVAYQPYLRLATGNYVAVEATVRWREPTDRQEGTGLFQLAEEVGLAADVSAWTLREACATVARWRLEVARADAIQLVLSVTPGWLRTPDFAAEVADALGRSGLPAEALVLALPGGETPEGETRARAAAAHLHRMGVDVGVAGFGQCSSLQSPRHLGASLLVLEPALVAGINQDVADAALVAGVVRLAHGLGLRTVAAGVDDEELATSLRLMGCDLAVGPWVAPTCGTDEFVPWWTDRHPHRPSEEVREPVPSGHPVDGWDDTAEEHRDEILTYLAHELRNPLGVLHSSIDLLIEERNCIDASLHDMLGIARQGITRLTHVVNALSDVRTAQLGTLRVARDQCDLVSEVRRAVAETPGLKDNVTLRLPAHCAAYADALRVRQVLDNLLGNAVKYSPPNSPVEVALEADGGVARVAVRDHGGGIPAERRHELFRKFARLGNAEPGTGLGLFLSRAIARAHGGDLVYERPDGDGARFVLTLPTGQQLPEAFHGAGHDAGADGPASRAAPTERQQHS